MRRHLLPILVLLTFILVAGTIPAIAGTGYYPNSPVMNSPSSYAAGSTVNFSLTAYNYYDGYLTGIPYEFYIELYEGGTLVASTYTGGSASFNWPGFPDDGTTYTWRVYAYYAFYDPLGNFEGEDTTYWSSNVSFTNGPSAPPPTPTITSPGYGANASGTTVSLQWGQAPRATNYYVQVATDSGFSSKIVDEWVGNYIGINLTLPDDGSVYYWRVAAGNSRGSSSYTGTYYFINGPSSIPAVPTPTSPGYGTNAGGSSVLLQWSQAARANDYYLVVATDPGFTNKIVDEWVGNYIGMYLNLPDDGTTFYWKVAAGNALGSSAYSSTYYFVNGPSAIPAVPIPSSPFNGSNVSGTTVSLQWGQAARATNYYLQVATDYGFTNPIVDEWIGDYIGINLNLLDDGQVFYWRVAAGNSLGTSNYSTTYYFTNGPSAVPPTPGMVLPGNTSKIDGAAVTFQWTQVARANDYRLQLAIDSGFTQVVFDEWLGNYIGIQLTGLPDNGQQFYWRVSAGNSIGSSPFTSGRSFVNGPSAAPGAPSMASPTNGAMASSPNVTFHWNPAPRANDYRLQLAIDSGFTEVVFDEWIGDYIGIQLSGFRDVGDQFYWRVAARNSVGESSFPYAWYFVNGPSSVPSAPALIAPGNNTEAEGSGLSFYWQPSARAEYYKIQVATDINFNNIMDEDTLYDTTAYITGFGNDGRTYYWRVAGINSLGTGPFSTSFKITNGMPQECTASIGTGTGVLGNYFNHLDTCKDIDNIYLLKDISRRTFHNGQMLPNADIRTEFYAGALMRDDDADNVWSAQDQASGVDAHHNTALTYDYLLNPSKLWYLNSYDGYGISMVSKVEMPCTQDNASWYRDSIYFCVGINHQPLSAALDIVAHEWGHAVTEKAAQRGASLIYAKESGALNEAFSDWLGMATKRNYGYPTWTLGDGVWIVRDMANPKSKWQPDTYRDPNPNGYWFPIDNCLPNCNYNSPGYNDCCGVHTNSGVPNKMFFLLANGGTHNNVTVQPIYIEKAIRIGVDANIRKWNANATFADALTGMVSSALELYGQDSFEMNQVKNAWAAVKVTTLPTISTSSSPTAGGTTTGGGSFEWGNSVTVTASPNTGYVFKNWTENGTAVSISSNYTFNVNGNRNLVANFVVIPPTISVTPVSNAFGSVVVSGTSTPIMFTVSNQGSQPLVIGTAYLNGANLADFTKDSDTCSGQSLAPLAECVIQLRFTPVSVGSKLAELVIPSNDSTTPTFEVQLAGTGVTVPVYTITATAGTGGSISPSGTVNVSSGGSLSFTFSPNTGYHISDVKIDGTSIGAQSSYSFSNVVTNHTIQVLFAINQFAITTSIGPGGTITPSTVMANYGSSQSFTITANSGYSIVDVLVDGVSHGAITSYTLSNVTSVHSISAIFSACGILPVSIDRSGSSFHPTYQTLQLGYDAALNGDKIQAHSADFTGDFNLNTNIAVAVDGGYSCDYTSKTGSSTVKGKLTISGGTLVVGGLVISN